VLPEDRVLVGVINRKRDLVAARDEHWYRIPQARMPNGIYAEYIGFFLSGAFKELNGAVHYYAQRRGLELAYRRDLLPKEKKHKRADDVYYKVQLGELIGKVPPIRNTGRRSISFIYTTWDRFVKAQTIGDLYSKADYFVDRIYHALRDTGVRPQRLWEAEARENDGGAQLRVMCEQGIVIASTDLLDGAVFLDEEVEEDALLAAILAEIARQGGPVTVNLPVEGYH
jgi:hypothetical protein